MMKNNMTREEILKEFDGKTLTSIPESNNDESETPAKDSTKSYQKSGSDIAILKIISNSSLRNELERFSNDYIHCRQTPIDTGSERINKMLGGGIFPGISVLGAMPATGKSTLALQIATEVARKGTPVLFFSFEMSSAFITAKIISRTINSDKSDTLVSTRSILNAEPKETNLREKLNRRIPKTAKELLEEDKLSRNLYVFDTSADAQMNTDKILEIVDLFCAEHSEEPSPLVIIDYLQILAMLEKAGGNNSQIRESNDSVIRKLTFRAHDKTNPLAILVISAISREHYQRSGGKKNRKPKQPQMDVFKESGFIEYSADYAFFLGPQEITQEAQETAAGKKKMNLRLTVLKNRYGSIGAYTDLTFYPAQDRFEETDDEVFTPDLNGEETLTELPAENLEEPAEKTFEKKPPKKISTSKKAKGVAASADKKEAPAPSSSDRKTTPPALKFPDRFDEDWN